MDPRISRGWLVMGEVEDECEDWCAKNPKFVRWTPEWFEYECADHVVADNSSEYGGGGEGLLFDSVDAARKYGERDAAIASGRREIEPVFFIDASFVREDCFPDEVLTGDALAAWEARWSAARDSGRGFFDDLLFYSTQDSALNALRELDSLQQQLVAEYNRQKNGS